MSTKPMVVAAGSRKDANSVRSAAGASQGGECPLANGGTAASSPSNGADFPELRILHRDDVLFHEKTDPARQVALVDRLSKDGVLRNPPIVGRLTESYRYLLLDGANRVAALDALDIRHVLVQVESYDNAALKLSHWNHVLRDDEAGTILDLLSSVPELVVKPIAAGGLCFEEGDGDAEELQWLCTVAYDGQRWFGVFGGTGALERVRLLGRICNLYYHGMGRIDRVSHTDLVALGRHHPSFGALLVYPDFSKDTIRRVVEAGARLPSGITRFLMPRRVLGFNIPLELLRSSASVKDKQRRLEQAIAERVVRNKARYYEEPVFVFDD